MILKIQDLKKLDLNTSKIALFYGKNESYKNEIINEIFENNSNIFKYEEKEILENKNIFLENIFSQSLFEKEKTIMVNRATDKLLKVLDELEIANLNGVKIIIKSENLEKKSKLRSFFEKSKKFICIAFYPDTQNVLNRIAYNFFKEKSILISSANLNHIVEKCLGDRQALKNELHKIEFYTKRGVKITEESIIKLINTAENYSISELIDNCLARNKKKTIHILNENNFSNDDCILIVRTFLNKSKKILKLSEEFLKNKNIDVTIASARPPIFWKDKEITKQQIYQWKPFNLKELIIELNKIELLIKKNFSNSINLINNFILEQSSKSNN